MIIVQANALSLDVFTAIIQTFFIAAVQQLEGKICPNLYILVLILI